MIDLRSDTLTLPSEQMLQSILSAPLGDSGRLDVNGRGGDPTVGKLEDIATKLTGKERAILMPSGTMGNHVSLMTHCNPGDKVLIDSIQHLYRTEKAAFESRFGQLQPVFYHLTPNGYPDVDEVEKILQQQRVDLICIENTHNGAGGTFIPVYVLKKIRTLANQAKVPIHMDGARLFNASIASGLEVKEICSYANSVMFCLSKGLGAPDGSMLCGNSEFILKAAATRKLLGGSMRQSGVIAACGIYALEHQIPDLAEDHRRAKDCLALLHEMKKIHIPEDIQSNIIILDVADTGKTPDEIVAEIKSMGVWLSVSGDTHVRIVLCRNSNDSQIKEAAMIIRKYEASL